MMGHAATVKAVKAAAVQSSDLSKQGLLERAFAFAFRGLVYAQIWEDPVVDMEALAIAPDSRIVAIASGGCNVLSYLTANPARITAVDLNTAHVALNRLKLTAARHLPDHEHFRRFFGDADSPANMDAYERYVRPHLDDVSRRYWEGRDLIGRRRIRGFSTGIYKRGLLGGFIGVAHAIARLYRLNPRELLEAGSVEQQRAIFDRRFAPVFDKRFVRWLTDQPASLFGLGIPPAQYEALGGGDPDGMASVLRARLAKLACDFDIRENYFAWQAFGRGYGKAPNAPVPPYLEGANYRAVVDRVDRVDIRHVNMTDHLRQQPARSLDRFVLLDAQDWMTDAQLGELWAEITRTARPDARVLFRTAAEPSLLPGRVPDAILARWIYAEAQSCDLTRRDRSSIYGGVHFYTFAG
jgi:S-adenosylmethionine-diacylglycerol 3-amino-3-carboxypropyl transferase